MSTNARQQASQFCRLFAKQDASTPIDMTGFGRFTLGETPTATAAGQADGRGIKLTGARVNALEVNADTGSTDLNGDYYVSAIKGNVVLGTSSSNASIIGVMGKLNTNTATFGSGDHYAVRGHLNFWGSSTLGGANNNTGAISAYIENEATTTVGAGTYLSGVCVYQVGNPTVNSGGYNPAIWIRSQTNCEWQYGIYAPNVERAAYFASSLTGSTALNAFEVAVTDATTNSSGYTRGLYVNATVSGAKTGSGEHNSIAIDQTVSGNTPYLYGFVYYSVDSGNPTIGLACPISIYQDDLGSAVSAWFGMDIGYAFSNDMAGQFSCIRMRNHSSTIKPESMILGQCNNNYYVADYFLDFQGNPAGPVFASTTSITSGTNTTYRIKCRYQGTDFYLLGVAAA